MASPIAYTQYTEPVVGHNHPTLTDTDNRPLRQVLASSGYSVDAAFPGLNGPVFNVVAYGAVGDGVTDDTAAFQAAIAAATAGRAVFGSTTVGSASVVVPTPTANYLITAPLTLATGLSVVGMGQTAPLIQFKPASNNSTLFTFFGTVSNQSAIILLRNLFCYQNGTAQTSIGFRCRNFGQVTLQDMVFSNFRVGVWPDWGTGFYLRGNCQINLCVRGVQCGGNLSQGELPAPPAGIRSGNNPFMDTIVFDGVSFSQNVVDINHLGSQVAHGECVILGCTFFESSTSPVTGKQRFVTTTNLKGLVAIGNWFESGSVAGSGRSGIVQAAFDYDGNGGGPNFGGFIAANHFLFTAAASTTRGVDIERGQATITGNTFEFAAASQPITLNDVTDPSFVFGNTYLTYPDAQGYTTPIVMNTSPANGPHLILGQSIVQAASTPSIFAGTVQADKLLSDSTGLAQLQFNLSGVRQAGINVTAVDVLRFYNSVGTVVAQLAMGASPGLTFAKGAAFPIGTTDANSLQLQTNALVRWAVDTSGNLAASTSNGGSVQARVGSAAAVAKAPVVVYQDANQLTTSTSDTSIGNAPYAMPGSAMAATAQTVRITARGRALTQAASFNVKFGGTVLATVTPAAGESWSFQATVSRTSSASQLACITTSHGTTFAESSASPAETMSGAINIDFRGSVTSGGTLRLDHAQVEVLAS